jgi:arylsulfatase A-like enzyme
VLAGLWTGLIRGLVLGLVGGSLAGVVEALSVLREATASRAGLAEAALYAFVIDALICAGTCALSGAAFGALVTVTRLRESPALAARFHLAGSTTIVLLFVGWLWAFRAQGADLRYGVPLGIFVWLIVLSLLAGAAVYGLAKSLSGRTFASTRRLAAVGLSATVLLALVIPAQVMLEARRAAGPGEGSIQALHPIDPALLQTEFIPDLLDVLARAPGDVSDQPNVVLITVDALRADHLGACGNDWIRTPAIDLLAQHSALSCNTFPQQPQTNPAVASLFTSTNPATHGVRVHMVDRLADSFDTLAEVLQRQGFNTAAVIPWTSLEPAFSGFHQGFHTYEAFVINEPPLLQNPATAALAAVYRRVTDQVALGSAVEAVLGMRQGTEGEIDGRADVTAAAALTWLTNYGDSGRFFFWVHFFDPHYPWTPQEPWDQLYDQGYEGRYDGGLSFVYEMREGVFDPDPRDVQYLRALYASEITYMDHYVGQLLGYMARSELLNNTVVVLTADHGESLGERGEIWPNGEHWLHGDDLYNPGVQVPLIVFDPRSRQQRTMTAPLQHIDIMPTILDLVGVPIPRQAQGRSIAPLLDGSDSGADRVAVVTLTDDAQTAIISGDGWKLITSRDRGTTELYYLPWDPEERNDVASLYPGQVLALSRQLDTWVQANGIAVASADGSDKGS